MYRFKLCWLCYKIVLHKNIINLNYLCSYVYRLQRPARVPKMADVICLESPPHTIFDKSYTRSYIDKYIELE